VIAIAARGLGKRYGHKWALRNCTLALPSGRCVGIVGPNGAGKTTLLHLVVGLAEASEGTIAVLDGLHPGRGEALARVAFVGQDTPLYPNLSVADTIRFVSSLAPRWDGAVAKRRLSDLGIAASHKVGKLSGGQRAQVALAVSLARHPELLVLDEPVARLDPLARHEFMATLMAAVAEEGTSVLFSSHVVSELERVCDYLILISDGRVQVSDDVEALIGSHKVFTGPAGDVADVAARWPVIGESGGSRQSRILVRTGPPGRFQVPPGWQVSDTNLEELVLFYLRSPDAAALSGPAPNVLAGISTAVTG
jgi:ABC-2 type transport system ATP-binding protein